MSTTSPEPLPETPDLRGAYPRLSDEQLEALAACGERRPTSPGQVLYREGDEGYEFFAILEGKVAALEGYGETTERVVSVHGPGRFLGELSLLTGQAALLTAVVRTPGVVVAVSVERLRELVAQDPVLGDLVLRAYLVHRSILIELGIGLRIIGSRFSPDTRRLLELAARNLVPHRWIDLEHDKEAETLVSQLGVKPEETPVVIWGERVLRNPSNAELARSIGLLDLSLWPDLVTPGRRRGRSGRSGRGRLRRLRGPDHRRPRRGGNRRPGRDLLPYRELPGVSLWDVRLGARRAGGHPGREVRRPHQRTRRDRAGAARRASRRQARRRVLHLGPYGRDRHRRPLPEARGAPARAVRGDERLLRRDPGRGQGLPQRFGGGGGGRGNSAGQATLFLAQHAARVRLVVREDALPRNMSRYLVDRIERLGGVEVLLNTEVRELVGDDVLETVVVEDNRTGERRTLDARAMFASASSPTPVGWATSSPWTTRASSSPAPTPPGPMGTTHRGVPVAKANGRDVIQLWDLPITKGLQERIHEFEDLNEEVELKPILDDLAQRSQLDLACSADTEARLPAIAGGLSLALEAGRRVRARSSAGRLAAGRPTLRGRLHPKRVMAAHRPGGRVPPTAPSGRPLIITAAPSGPVARPSERSTP